MQVLPPIGSPDIDDRQLGVSESNGAAGSGTPKPSQARTEAFRTLFDTNYADIDRYCRRRAPDARAADAVSETFLIVWRRFDDLPSGPDARLWLYGTARNVLANLHRSQTRQERLHRRMVDEPTRLTLAVENASQDPAAVVIGEPSPVIDAMATLSPDDQEVLALIAWEGLTHAEAAVVLGCSTNAVGIRMHRARHRLADAIEKATS